MSFEELLGTKNKREQETRIQELLKKEALPWVSITLVYDQIEDSVSVNLSGGDISYDTIHHVLELAAKGLRKEEIRQILMEVTKTKEE